MRLRKELMAAEDKLKWGINIKTNNSALKAVSAKSDEVAKSSDNKSEDTNLRGFL